MDRARRVTISLPESVVEAADRVAAREHRSRSDVMREALMWHLRIRELPVDDATPEEIEAFERGRAEIARGESTTHEEILRDLR